MYENLSEIVFDSLEALGPESWMGPGFWYISYLAQSARSAHHDLKATPSKSTWCAKIAGRGWKLPVEELAGTRIMAVSGTPPARQCSTGRDKSDTTAM
mmetsp:Transcript_26266/g.60655  ORF Transcript_26266/g.60655 Transcript_26266/m.60655 type:complete len:98 (+) Transcript_26266:334-627(+)